MEKSLTKAVANALLASFEGSKVFSQTIKQGLSDGDFLIGIKSISSSYVPADYIKRTIEYSLTAFTTAELLEKLDVLIAVENAVKLIDCEGLKIRGYFGESKIEDDNVVLYPKYTFYTQNVDEYEDSDYLMGNLDIE